MYVWVLVHVHFLKNARNPEAILIELEAYVRIHMKIRQTDSL